MAEFWFIRHFRTPWNAEGRLQGQRDIALDDQDMATLAVNRLALGETFADFTARIMRIRQRVLAV
ncbi:Histidine phosphatase superfamily (branch 1) [Paracoccus alcaliphilus]|uniref:Histidine phosphatase superfamily (Branch 1) n=1 Tax=Paracoccus alcaliphilus TaxID=34002 RepID=A0A1H8HTV9_9RHOB|nr:histidine phosphatase family protein [Paracoccus alcaliphilus]WCR19018.1 histidine phosphatase family protein [Paracoccus alcaliphilus]SEN59602.1 Histidine phosphatase superfamily (branch 1) [Paracoccus alcaliphilus]